MRFWLTVAVFAVLNLTAWIAYHAWWSRVPDLVQIEAFQPGNDNVLRSWLVTESKTSSTFVNPVAPQDLISRTYADPLRFRFNLAMDVGDDLTQQPPGRIIPPLAGTWKWDDGRTLSFQPEQPPLATTFIVTLDPQVIRTKEGFHLGREFTASFRTTPFEIRDAGVLLAEDEGVYQLKVDCSDVVLPGDAQAAISVRENDGTPVPIRACAVQGTRVVLTTESLNARAQQLGGPIPVTLTVKAGLSGRSGPLGLSRERSFSLLLDSALRLERVNAAMEDDDEGIIRLEFNRWVKADALRQVLRVEPSVAFSYDGEGSSSTIALRGAFRPGQRYAVVIAAPPVGVAGTFPLVERMPVWIPDQAPCAWFPAGSGRLGTQGSRSLTLKTVNLRGATLRMWRLYDNNLVNWVTRADTRGAWLLQTLGQPLVDRRVVIGAEKNRVQDLRINLERELPPDARGDGVVLVEVDENNDDRLTDLGQSPWSGYGYQRGASTALVSLSDLALTCHRGADGCTVWVTSLATALPVADVRVRVFSTKQQLLGTAVSGADGVARVVESPLATGDHASVVIADTPSGRVAWLGLMGSDGLRDPLADTGGTERGAGLSAFVYGERGVWRPGETAHLRAIIRDGSERVPAPVPLRWRIRRPDWKVWRETVATTLPSGDLLLDLPLPSDAPTGAWLVDLTLPGDDRSLGQVPLQIEDFMPDRLVVAFNHTGPGLLAEQPGKLREVLAEQGDLTLRARADYLFGKPASGRTLKAWARLDPTAWQPEGAAWSGWTFGDDAGTRSVLDHGDVGGTRIDLPPVPADEQGAATWDIPLAARCAALAQGRARPWRLLTGGEVQEVGGRAVSGSAVAVIVHPVRTWLGAHLVQDGSANVLDLRTASASGTPENLTATVQLRRDQWDTVIERTHGITRYRSVRDLVPQGEPAKVVVTAQGVRWTVPTDLPPGTYVVCIEVQETRQLLSLYHRPGAPAGWYETLSRERPDRCEVSVRVAPPLLPVAAPVDAADGAAAPAAVPAPVMIDPQAPLQIGGEALVTIRAPFAGRALVSVCTDRVLSAQVVEMTGNVQELRLPVTNEWRSDAFVCVSVVRQVEASDQVRLHRAWGVVRARTDASARRLTVELQVADKHLPGTVLPISGVVHAGDGSAAAGATVTISAVDEGILRLTTYRTPDPFAWLIRPRALGVQSWDLFNDLLPELPRIAGDSPTGGDGGDDGPAMMTGRYQSPVTAKRVVPFAFWSGLLIADADGRISAEVPVPAGFNGRVRIMAAAAAATGAGMSERWSTVRGPVVLQTSWPRFAAPGDRFRVSATVTNLAGGAGTVTTRLVLPGDGLLTATTVEQTQPVADGGEAQVVFEVTAAQRSGVAQAHITSELQVSGVASPHLADDAVELPVRPASPRISVGGEAVVTAAAPWHGALPDGFLPGSGVVEVRLAPRPTLALPRGLDYLYRYPHGCAEQLTSACFPLVHLREVGDQVAPDLFLPEGITRRINEGITRLQLMETDGGISMWPGQRAVWSWTTVYTTHFLVEAKRAGHAVPEDFLRRMLDGCRRLDTYNEWRWAETQAYACYVLALAGQPAHALMQRLEDLLKIPTSEAEIGPSTRSWLGAAWMEAGRKDLATALLPQQLPTMRSGRHLDGDLASPIRDRAVLLATLLDVMPDHPGIPTLAQDLAKLAPWPSTQDTSFALLALGRYLRYLQRTPLPDAVFLRVDGQEVGTPTAGPARRWSGTDGKTLEARIDGGADARAWVSWLVTGVPLTPPADATHGLTVKRRWSDEHGNDLAGKTLTSGDLVQVELIVTGDTAYRGVVVEDLLPAGLEIENARLATTANNQPDLQVAQGWRTEVRDDRLVTMGNLYQGEQGRWQLRTSYLARAVTPGTYVLPPLRAECMYDITINGIAGAGTVTVLPAK